MFTYQEALDYILGTPNPGSVYERNVINTLLKELGDPQKDMKYVHIAGTNGKGSTSAFMASILRCAGYRTGLYTSPFIQRFNERIQVNGVQIPDEAIAEITTEIAAATERVQALGYRRPTIFELITALGFVWFKRSKCEIVVLEVGMGGRLDATNAIDESEVAAIVNIGFDHM
jgi:dihydrofolate synthase/folylpolyglutamate synthase